MRRRGFSHLPWVVLVALCSACFARLLACPSALIVDGVRPSIDHANHRDPRPLGNDVTFVFLPHHLYIAKILAEFGHLPAWDSSGFGGRPLVGNPQSGIFYPPVWVAWISSNPATLGWLTVGHLLWGGAGLYVLARNQGLSRWPATVAAGVYQASPYLLAQTFEGHYPHVWAASWFPWAFWAHAEVRCRRIGGLLALPLILAMTALTGHLQEWLLLLIALSVWTGVDVLQQIARGRPGRRAAVLCLARWVGIVGVGICLTAVEIVPAQELLPWLQRSTQPDGSLAVPQKYLPELVSGLQLLWPMALGGPADYFGEDNYWESVISFGLIPLVLIGIGIGAARKRVQARGWVILVALSICFAAGRQLGFYALLQWLLPGLNWFRVPARSLFLSSLGGAMLAGFGLESLDRKASELARWRRGTVRLGWTLVSVVGLLLILRCEGKVYQNETAAPGLREIDPSGKITAWAEPAGSRTARHVEELWRAGCASHRILHAPSFWITVAGLSIPFAAGCLSIPMTRRSRLGELVGLFALLELAWHGFSLIQVTPQQTLFRPDTISECLLQASRDQPNDEPIRVRARDTVFLDLQAVRYGIEKTNINDVFQLQHAAALYETLYPVAARTISCPETPMSAAVKDYRRRVRQGVFDRLAVSYLVSDRFESDPPWPIETSGLQDGSPFVIHRNPTAMPRAYVVPRALVMDDDPALILSRFRTCDTRTAVIMSFDPLQRFATDRRCPMTPARWLSRDPDRPVFEVTTVAPGLLVVADTWMSGWRATVDGKPAPIYRGNIAQRVIPLEEPGRHTIVLEYHPPGWELGCLVTAVSAFFWITVCGLAVRIRSA
jgi:hypothetical protein